MRGTTWDNTAYVKIMYCIEGLKYTNVSMQFCDTAYIMVHSGMVKWT